MNKYTVMNTLFSVIGGSIIGGAVTYLVTKKHFEEYANEEIEKVRHHYALIRKDQNVVSILGDMPSEQDSGNDIPVDEDRVRQSAETFIRELGYNGVPEQEESSQNIFDKAVPEEEVGEEVEGPQGQPKKVKKKIIVTGNESVDNANSDPRMADYVRISGEPYIISQDEMFNTETEWEKPTLSYYEGDDTLVDERLTILDMTHRMRYVGERHLSMFGVLSEDENIVYVRSPQISSDFEIILEPGKYSVRVLGEPDYEEAEKQRVRRMRDSD